MRSTISPHKLLTSTLTFLVIVRFVQAIDFNATTTVIALALPQTGIYVTAGGREEETEGYFALSKAVQSAMRLAADDVNAAGTVMEGNLSLALVEVDTPMSAVKGLCDVLEALGEVGAYGVGPFAT